VIGSVATPGAPNGVALYGRYACIADGAHGITIADVSDPTNPVIIGEHPTLWTCWNVAVHGSMAYVTDQYSLECFDLAKEPSMVGPLATIDSIDAVDVAVQDTVACIACLNQGLRIFSVADPLNPRALSAVAPPGVVEGVEVRGDLAYTANWGGGVSITRIANPRAPTLLATVGVNGPAWDLDVEGSFVYVAASDLFVIDVVDPLHPTVVATVRTSPGQRARRVDASGSYVYVTDETTGLVIVDVSTPEAPVLIRTVPIDGGAYTVKVQGDHAYVSGKNDGFFDVDISSPSQAYVAGFVQLRVCGMRLAIDDRYVYVASNWAAGLHIIDVGEPSDPKIVGELLTMTGGQGIDIADGYVYLADQPFLTVAALHCPSPLSGLEDSAVVPAAADLVVSARPNPSSGPIRFAVELGLDEIASLTIHDEAGRCIRRMTGIVGLRGDRFIDWDGCDGGGRPVANGSYYARLRTHDRVGRTRVIVLR
jgi:hypothetical protein